MFMHMQQTLSGFKGQIPNNNNNKNYMRLGQVVKERAGIGTGRRGQEGIWSTCTYEIHEILNNFKTIFLRVKSNKRNVFRL